ncbi:substrate-binding domain-containing protein [Streptomyces sp. WMMC500]|uniref:substrate-binding domain-containing protein n=1 Tax=Streptomyces sp. WMMC500 TaxID=3015154 RepID=UPI00248C2065|nr:substrate-binding domain-containing protein [Streptomyces sp. WMMC500]WBB63555.1 substrate-binding domain-containing protein [Streptomyces sp. WMMC500]
MNVNIKRAAVALGAAALGVGLMGAPAQADPPAGEYRQLVAVGSDTTQDVLNGIGSVVEDLDGTPSDLLIASYDATGPSPIKTRPVNCEIPRPNGSSAGITALRNDIDAGTNCIDFARSSREPNTAGSLLTFVPFALDAVAPAVRSNSPMAGHDFDLAELQGIYQCEIDTVEGVAVTPLLPQAGSGTRSFWAGQMGIDANDPPDCVSDVNGAGQPVQEHDGRALTRTSDIAPYSIAQYIAQTNSAQTGVEDRRGAAVLQTIDGAQPVVGGQMNAGYPINRDVFNVFQTTRLGQADINRVFTGSDAELCTTGSAAAQQRALFGFAASPNCGQTDLTGNS